MADRTLICVPGLLCSTLSRHIEGVGTQVQWLGVLSLLSGNLPRLKLDGPPYVPPSGDDGGIIPGQPLPAYFVIMIDRLRRLGWRCVSPDMDWRRPYVEDAARLAQLLRDETKDKDVWLLCHSRGGLVTRRAFGMLDGEGVIAKVKRVVGLGVPHEGSLEAVCSLAGWGGLAPKLEALGKYSASYVGTGLGFEQIRLILRSWPSVYELLPSPTAPWLFVQDRLAIYNPASYVAAPVPPFSAYFPLAAASWASLTIIPVGMDWVDVACNINPTYTGVKDPAALGERGSLGVTDLGDGVVPFASAHQSPRRVLITPTAHDMMPLDGRLLPVVSEILLNGLAEDRTLTGPLLRSP